MQIKLLRDTEVLFCLQVWLRNNRLKYLSPLPQPPPLGKQIFYSFGSLITSFSSPSHRFPGAFLKIIQNIRQFSIYYSGSQYVTGPVYTQNVYLKRKICTYLIIFSFAPPWNFDFRFAIGVRAAGQGELQPFPPHRPSNGNYVIFRAKRS